MKPIVELLKDYFLQRALLYGIIAFFSFFVVVPLGDLRSRFTDDHCSRCILYSDLEYITSSSSSNNASGQTTLPFYHIRFGDQEVCEYAIAVVAVFCLIYPIIVAIVYVFMYRKDSQEVSPEQKLDLSHFLFLVHIGTELCMVVMVLVVAGMVTAGFEHLCSSLAGGQGLMANISSCSEGQSYRALWGVYDGSNFHDALSVATAGSWFLFVSWLLQGLLGIWKLWRLGMLPVSFSAD